MRPATQAARVERPRVSLRVSEALWQSGRLCVSVSLWQLDRLRACAGARLIRVILSLVIALLALTAGGSTAQQTGASRTALVTASDARGRAIVDLGPDDFIVTE